MINGRRISGSTVLAILLAGTGCLDDAASDPEEGNEVRQSGLTSSERALALRWAPIVYQDVSPDDPDGSGGKADFMTEFNFDGNFNGLDNWDNLMFFQTFAFMYAAVSESTSHWFIYYVIYHPRDWTNDTIEPEHEHDAEGAVMAVRKSGTFGTLEAVITTWHSDWFRYTASPSVTGPTQLRMESLNGELHPALYQEYEGHGLRGCTSSTNCGQPSNNDMIKYLPTVSSAALVTTPVIGIVPKSYTLLSLNDVLYKRRFDRPTFANPNTLRGNGGIGCGGNFNACGPDRATLPWAHIDSEFSTTSDAGVGERPASVFAEMFTFANGAPSTNYTSNKLLHSKCHTGRHMKGSTDSCVQQICAVQPSCCGGGPFGGRFDSWTQSCVDKVETICGLSCRGCRENNANITPNICAVGATPIGNGCEVNCADIICSPGGPLNQDSFCCHMSWDAQCVSEVASHCALSCNDV